MTAPVTLGNVGAHLQVVPPEFGGAPGEAFAAVVALSGPSDYPDSLDLSTPDVRAVTRIALPAQSLEASADLDTALAPGWYAIVLGSGRFGANGGGGATLNNALLGSPSVFGAILSGSGWGETPGLPVRIFARRQSVELATCESELGMCQQAVITGNGDVNGDGLTDILDNVLFRRWLAGYPTE